MLEFIDAYQNEEGVTLPSETDEEKRSEEEQLLYDYVLDEIVALEILQMLAQENNVLLTAEEQVRAEECAQYYMEHTDEKTLHDCSADAGQVTELIEKYVLAQKTIAVLTEGADLEVSENEARAISIQIMEFWEEEAAWEALDQIRQGTSFQQVYLDRFQETPLEHNITRGTLLAPLEAVAFSLQSGEMSDVVSCQEEETGEWHYFILYCCNDYIPELTQANMETIKNRKKTEIWMERVIEKRGELSVYLEERQLKTEQWLETDGREAQFFAVFEQFFGTDAPLESAS